MRHSRGFSLLELMIAVILVGVVSIVLLDRLFYYQEVLEKAEMEYTINAVKSSLRLRIAKMLVAGRAQELRLLAAENPMEWMENKPRNYLGTYNHAAPEQLAPGNWYFDTSAKTLVYIARRNRYLQLDEPGEKRILWKIELVPTYVGNEAAATSQRSTDHVSIKLIHSYKWF